MAFRSFKYQKKAKRRFILGGKRVFPDFKILALYHSTLSFSSNS